MKKKGGSDMVRHGKMARERPGSRRMYEDTT